MTPMTMLREVNLRIYQLTRDFDGAIEFLCECGHPLCAMTPLPLLATDFADVIASSGRLLVASGHEQELEVVRRGGSYLIVRDAAVASSAAG